MNLEKGKLYIYQNDEDQNRTKPWNHLNKIPFVGDYIDFYPNLNCNSFILILDEIPKRNIGNVYITDYIKVLVKDKIGYIRIRIELVPNKLPPFPNGKIWNYIYKEVTFSEQLTD